MLSKTFLIFIFFWAILSLFIVLLQKDDLFSSHSSPFSFFSKRNLLNHRIQSKKFSLIHTDSTTTSSNSTTNSSNSTSNSSNSTPANFSFTWTGLVYSLDFEEAVLDAQLWLNITSPYSQLFYTESLANGSFSDTKNLTSNNTYNGTLNISAFGYSNMTLNFSINSSLSTTLDFGQLNMSYVWPSVNHTRNLTGTVVAYYICNGTGVLLGVNASVEIEIFSSTEDGEAWIYPRSSTTTNEKGEFSTSLPVFSSSSGKLSNYAYDIIITPADGRIVKYEEEMTMVGSEWETTVALGTIVLDENVEGDEGIQCPV